MYIFKKINKKQLYFYYWIRKLSTRKIGKKFNVSFITVCRALKKFNIKTIPPNRYANIITAKKLKLWHYKKQLTCKKIAKLFRCNNETVSIYMKKFKLPIIYLKGKFCSGWRGGKKKRKCSYCKKIIYIKKSKVSLINFCNRKCMGKWETINRCGKNNGNYIHGLSYFPYPIKFNKLLKNQVRKRDNYKCQCCGIKEKYLIGFHKKLDIHHIDYNKQNCKEQNLISLCKQCNSKVNAHRDYWYAYFKYIMENNLRCI